LRGREPRRIGHELGVFRLNNRAPQLLRERRAMAIELPQSSATPALDTHQHSVEALHIMERIRHRVRNDPVHGQPGGGEQPLDLDGRICTSGCPFDRNLVRTGMDRVQLTFQLPARS
jgi:hypothetical protein